jgi:hypothetical protein
MVRDCEDLESIFPRQKFIFVKGNNDPWTRDASFPDERAFTLGGKKFFICHGHKFHVKSSLALLKRIAQEKECDIVLFGHTHKAYIENDGLSLYGTNNFNLVWEDACKVVFGNKLDCKIKDIFDDTIEDSNKTLLQYIEKPIWLGYGWNVKNYKEAKDTLIPDLISIDNASKSFRIFDAKYYNLQMEEFGELKGQPGVESITKQYLYQLAYQKLIDHFGIEKITNAFLFPTESEVVDNRGTVTLPMMEAITIGENKKLSPIQVVFLPVSKVFNCYLNNVLFKEDLMLDNESM